MQNGILIFYSKNFLISKNLVSFSLSLYRIYLIKYAFKFQISIRVEAIYISIRFLLNKKKKQT